MNLEDSKFGFEENKFGIEASQNLKRNILARQGDLKQLEDQMNVNREKTAIKEEEQEVISKELASKCDMLKEQLETKFELIEEKMKNHFAKQKAESSRLQSQLTALKGQEKLLNGQFVGLMQRLKQLKMQVGNVDQNTQ